MPEDLFGVANAAEYGTSWILHFADKVVTIEGVAPYCIRLISAILD